MMRLGYLSAFILLGVTGCGEQHASITVKLDGKQIYTCAKAAVSELTPTPGGWAFKCDDGGTSVYLEYETEDTPAKGTIETILVKKPYTATMLPAYHATLHGIDCASAKAAAKDRGPAALETSWGGIESTTFKVPLAQPCGELEVAIVVP